MPLRHFVHTACAAALIVVCGAAAAHAQQPANPAPAPGGPLVLEPLHNGFLIGPSVKFTKIDGKAGTLAGLEAGWLKDDHLFIGGAGYWRADNKRRQENLAYGGLVVGWFFNPDQPFSVSAKALAGLGRFSQPVSIQPVWIDPWCYAPNGTIVAGAPMCQGWPVTDRDRDNLRYRTDFFVFEPEIGVQARLSSHVRLNFGAGYRAIDGVRGLDRVAQGATGNVSVQINFGK